MIVTTIQGRGCPRAEEVGARVQGPVGPVHPCRVGVGVQAKTYPGSSSGLIGPKSLLFPSALPLDGARSQILGAVQMFKGDSGKWSRWALGFLWGLGVGRAAAGGCEGARARAKDGSNVCAGCA